MQTQIKGVHSLIQSQRCQERKKKYTLKKTKQKSQETNE